MSEHGGAIADTRTRLEPGIHFDVPDWVYHGDPAPEPSLSAGSVQDLLSTSPARAAFNHPRLNPCLPPRESTQATEDGSILHRLITGAGCEIVHVKSDAWRTKEAKTERQAARDRGAIPVLTERLHDLEAIAAAARRQLEAHPEAQEVLSEDYASEVTMIWREPTGAMCRARPDRMHRTDGSRAIYDYKFTDRLQSPFAWDKTALNSLWDMRASFYQRGNWRLRGKVAPYRFIVVEKAPPYDVMVLQLTPDYMALGERKAEEGIHAWETCVREDRWPPYPRRIFHVSPPRYANGNWADRPDIEHMLPTATVAPMMVKQSLAEWIESDPLNPMLSG